MPAGPEWFIVLAVVLVIFGGSQLPKLAKNLGKAQKEFKDGLAAGELETASSHRLLSASPFGATIVQVPWAAATSRPSFSISTRTTAIRLLMAMISLVARHTPVVTGARRLSLNSVVAAQ